MIGLYSKWDIISVYLGFCLKYRSGPVNEDNVIYLKYHFILNIARFIIPYYL